MPLKIIFFGLNGEVGCNRAMYLYFDLIEIFLKTWIKVKYTLDLSPEMFFGLLINLTFSFNEILPIIFESLETIISSFFEYFLAYFIDQ